MSSIESVDEKGGWLYYSASPENATQRYLPNCIGRQQQT